jgi:hypothetical protein
MREGKKTTQAGTSSGKDVQTTNQERNPRGSNVKYFQCRSDAENDNDDNKQYVSASFKGTVCSSPIPICTHIKFVNCDSNLLTPLSNVRLSADFHEAEAFLLNFCKWEPGQCSHVVTRLRAGKSDVKIPAGGRYLSLTRSVQTNSEVHAASYFFLVGKAGEVRCLPLPPSNPEGKNAWSCIFSLSICLRGKCKNSYTFHSRAKFHENQQKV